jgi:predicted nuclease with TOPRIM domain
VLDEYREKLMRNPENYVALLRRQNQLHCVWHLELQDKITALEAENAQLREELNARD